MPPRRRRPKALVALEGPSGVGKTTVLRGLVRRSGRLGIAEAVDGAADPPSLDVGSRVGLRRLEVVLARMEFRRCAQAQDLLAAGNLLLLDTGFLGPLTYTHGIAERSGAGWDVTGELSREYDLAARAGRWRVPDLTIYLDAAPAVADRRAASDPVGHPTRLRERHAAIGELERSYWLGPIRSALPHRVVRVGAEGRAESVVESVLRAVRFAPPLPTPGRSEALAVVEALRLSR